MHLAPKAFCQVISQTYCSAIGFNSVSMVSYVRMYHWPGLVDCENVYNCRTQPTLSTRTFLWTLNLS